MLTSFKSAFKDKPKYEIETPEPILKMINQSLPDGFKYENLSDGYCRIATDNEFIISSININLPEKAKSILSLNYKVQDLWDYLYNTQQKVQILPDENGCYLISGKKIKATEMIKAPLKSNIKCNFVNLYLIPPKFPEPREIEIGTDKEMRKIKISRIPHESITEIKFSTISEGAFVLSYIFDKLTQKIQFNFTVSQKRAISIDDIVFANEVFNAFLSGEGFFGEIKLPITDSRIENFKTKEEIEFWKTLCTLEDIFNVKFDPSIDITIDLVNTVKLLRRCFIDKKPYKKYMKYENITGKGNNDYSEIEDLVGKEVYFEMITDSPIDILGQKLNLYELVGVFNAVVKSQQLQKGNLDNDFCIELEAKRGSKMYSGNMLFINEDELSKYKENVKHMEQLRAAEDVK